MIDENIRAQPPAREDGGDRPIEASWTDGVTHAYVNLSAALSAERQAWRQKLGLRIASVRYLDVEVPQAREKAQPVAWRSVWSDGTPYGEPHSWPPLDGASVYHGLMGRTIQPLYAAPPAPEDEKLRVAVEALIEARNNLIQCGDHFGAGQCADAISLIALSAAPGEAD